MSDLLPCPHCRGEAICDPWPVGSVTYYKVLCRNVLTCCASGGAMPTEAEAKAVWNRRANMPAGLTAEPAMTWRCFHCNYVATTKAEAIAHFGSVMNERPAICVGAPAGAPTAPAKPVAGVQEVPRG